MVRHLACAGADRRSMVAGAGAARPWHRDHDCSRGGNGHVLGGLAAAPLHWVRADPGRDHPDRLQLPA